MNRTEFDARIDSVLLYAERLIPKENLPDLPYMELAPTVHDWYAWIKNESKRYIQKYEL